MRSASASVNLEMKGCDIKAEAVGLFSGSFWRHKSTKLTISEDIPYIAANDGEE